MTFNSVSDINVKLIFLCAGVKFPDLNAAIIWAVGSIETPVASWLETWNHTHKDVFEMKGDASFFDTVYLMGEAYAKRHYGVQSIPATDPMKPAIMPLIRTAPPPYVTTPPPSEFKEVVDETIEKFKRESNDAVEKFRREYRKHVESATHAGQAVLSVDEFMKQFMEEYNEN